MKIDDLKPGNGNLGRASEGNIPGLRTGTFWAGTIYLVIGCIDTV
jgi:hypothetical protein